ncbi:unnamed protein product [Sphagnum jensenii]|jgi:hypothetical protein|uniref:Uncharacterized protein n=1 Tax=Sphagnum jensenii TaxID=128206 RepID=A0ABP0WZP8_9BRYO
MKLTTTQSAHHLGTLFYQFRFTTIVVKDEVARRFCNEGGGLMAMVCTATSSSDLVLCAGTGSYRRAPAPRWGETVRRNCTRGANRLDLGSRRGRSLR